jgi:vWA-MoxR associated protein C-terminal domain
LEGDRGSAAVTTDSVNTEHVYALVVGIEKYKGGSEWDLNGPAKDALKFASWLLDRGVKPAHIQLFLSPLDKNVGVLGDAKAKGLNPFPADRNHIDSAIRSQLTSEGNRGDLLDVFWGGHGIITKTGATTRRLFFSDTDNINKWNLNFDSLVEALSTFVHGSGFKQQNFWIDACANTYYQGLYETIGAEAAASIFITNGEQGKAEQFVLLAAAEYEVATNESTEGTGRFSRAVLDELAGKSLLPDMKALAEQIKADFRERKQSEPVYKWLKVIGDEEVIDNLDQEIISKSVKQADVFQKITSEEICQALATTFPSKSLGKAIKGTITSQKDLEKLAQNALNLDLTFIVNVNQSLDDIIFDFVRYLNVEELIKPFIRHVICKKNNTVISQFVIDNLDFLLTCTRSNSSLEEVLRHKTNLLAIQDFNLVVKAFNDVFNQLKFSRKVIFSSLIESELNYIRITNIPKEVRLFILLDILISDYPFFSDNNEVTTLDKLDFYLNRDFAAVSTEIEQKAYLQIVFRPSALVGQVILIAYLSFEETHNNGQTELSDMIPIKYEQSKSTMENSSIKFSERNVMIQILKFIKNSLEEIDRRQRLGYQISAPLMIEFFLPFNYLFKKIDRWTSPFGVGTLRIPLGDRYKIVFRSYNRLIEAEYRVSLRRNWLTEIQANGSFACISQQVISEFHMFNDKAGLACFLHKSKKFREGIFSIALEKGIPIIMWFEPNQKTINHLCDDPNSCSNHLTQRRCLVSGGNQELQQCILARLIQASQRHSLNDLHAIYDSIEEIKNQVGSGGYFAILYDEPNRLSRLAGLFKDTNHETFSGINV